MEKFSSVERVVGNRLDKEKVFEKQKGAFDKPIFDEEFFKDQNQGLEAKEKIKSKEETEILLMVNDYTNALRKKLGLEGFDITPEHYHIIPHKDWRVPADGFYVPMHEVIYGHDEEDSRLSFFKMMLHETIHMKSHVALQADSKEENGETGHFSNSYRSGLRVFPRGAEKAKNSARLTNLDEAVTEELTRRVLEEHANDPMFKNETIESRDLKSFELYHVIAQEEPFKVRLYSYGYREQRHILYALMDKIVAKNESLSKDDVLDVFAKAEFTGNLLPLKSLLDESFGRGTFIELAKRDTDLDNTDALKEYVRSLEPALEENETTLEQGGYPTLADIEASANYEGNDSLAVISRVRHVVIHDQIVDVLYKERVLESEAIKNEDWEPYVPKGWTGQERFFKGKTSGRIIHAEHLEWARQTPLPIQREEIEQELDERINQVKSVTEIEFSSKEPSASRMTTDWKAPWSGEKLTGKQMSIVEAHEKGHRIRQYSDILDPIFAQGFDPSKAEFTEEDYRMREEEWRHSEDAAEGHPIPSREEILHAYVHDYLFTAREIAERMSQLKNYFGMDGAEQFTLDHLHYAKEHYVADTGVDNAMHLFFEAITPETENRFLELINSAGI